MSNTSFAIILMGKTERAGCFALFVFLVSRDCCVALPHGATLIVALTICEKYQNITCWLNLNLSTLSTILIEINIFSSKSNTFHTFATVKEQI